MASRDGGPKGHLLIHLFRFLYRLKPFTSYKFRVKATNDIGDSEFSEESEPLTTLQAGQRPLLGLSLGPLGSSGRWAFSLWGGGLQRWRDSRPAGSLVWLPGQTPKEIWVRGAFSRAQHP